MQPSNFSRLSTGRSGISRREALMKMGVAGAGVLLAGGMSRAQGADAAAGLAGAVSETGGGGAGLAGEQPGFYRFKIGAFDAIAFNDGGMIRPLAQSPVGAGEPAEALMAALREAFLSVTHVQNQFNVLLVQMGAERVLFDSGCGSAMGASAGRLLRHMEAAGVRPEQITAVFLSHAHRDHFGGLIDARTKQAVFPNALHYIGRREFDFWTGASPDVSELRQSEEGRNGMIAAARGALQSEALRERWQFIEAGERLTDGLEIVAAPGHTPGHLGFLISSGGDQLLHLVDTANHHVLSFSRPERTFAFDVLPEMAAETRRKLLDRAAADRLRVFGAHLPFPALGHVRTRGDGFEYVIEPWVAG